MKNNYFVKEKLDITIIHKIGDKRYGTKLLYKS